MPTAGSTQLNVFAATAPGLESLCAAELVALGVRPRVVDGGVAWRGSITSVMRANLWLRTATRVLVRVAEFRARAFYELEKQARKIDWAATLSPGAGAEFRVTCRKSKLYHSDAVAQRFEEAVTRAVGGVQVARVGARDDDDASAEAVDDPSTPHTATQLFVVRLLHDVATVSIDTSGDRLNLRGYRQALAKAPLRETLAAATLLGAGWDGTTALTDPFCGSGTIPIEAALIARRMAPGKNRSFAFWNWPSVNSDTWTSVAHEARAGELAKAGVAISGSDRDAGAIVAARANAERAGVADDVTFAEQAVSALPPLEAPGLVVTNPPYGVRIDDGGDLRNLYAQFGNILRARRPGWRVALLSADQRLERQLGLNLEERLATRNGGIPVRLVAGVVE